MIEVDIFKKFKGFTLQASFSSNAHTMGILGASGSGKSMTLKCIAGIEKPDRGRIVVNGKVLFDSEKKINVPPQQRKVGYLFQNYALFPHMTVKKNIETGYHGAKKDMEERIRHQIAVFRLQGLEERFPSQLSGGQQQRAAFARMLMGDPMMIMLDEPFSALDSYLKDILQREMTELLAGYKGDLLMVSHSRDEIFRMCERVCLMKDGQSFLCDSTKRVFSSPQYLEAAKLTGCKNFSKIEKLDEYHVKALDWGIVLRTEEKVEEGVSWVGIRGHWLRPSEEEQENAMEISVTERIETAFEHQCLIKNKKKVDSTEIWWMRPKKSPGTEMDILPRYLVFPAGCLMLLR